LPHRVLAISEASGLLFIDVHIYKPVEIEAKAAELFEDSSVIDLLAQTVVPGYVDAHVSIVLYIWKSVDPPTLGRPSIILY
jgi:cytosine/adenosine deaminase-related metal-dependent hydrolase